MRPFLYILLSGILSAGIALFVAKNIWTTEQNPTQHRPGLELTDAADKGISGSVWIQNLDTENDLEARPTKVGSGAIISEDGYIVTNYHVIQGNEMINVTLSDNRVFNAALIGADTSLDLALIRIDATGLPFLTFADSDSIKLGEKVIAIGNPHRLQFTITSGVVSSRARPSLLEGNRSPYFIQTDVPINNGNSGGPLLNAMGELIGINIGFVTISGDFEGYSLAIPGNIVKYVADQLLNYNESKKGSIGMRIRNVTKDDADAVGLQTRDGVVVDAVTSEGAADVSGLQSLDIITHYNGAAVAGKKDFQERLLMTRPGDVLKLGINRNGKAMEIDVTLQ